MSSAELTEVIEPRKKNNVKYASICAILASMAYAVLGYDVGVMSGAAMYIMKDLKITDVQLEILFGILNLYSLIGSFAGARTSDWIGRRLTVLFAAVISFVGALLMGFAVNYGMLMVGRFVAGVGLGYGAMIAPMYTAEISPAASRGFNTSFPEVFINVGLLLGYISNYAFAGLPLHLGWRVMLGIGAAPSALLALLVICMPESPRWLVMKGRLADARAVLEKTSASPEEAAERLADIKVAAGIPKDLDGDVVTVPKERNRGEMQVWKELIFSPTPAMRRILLSGVGVHFFQQASGIDSVALYSPSVFKSAGITGDKKLLGVTCAVGVSKTLFILVAMFLLDGVGRRPLLLTSVGGMVISLIGLGTGLTVVGHHPDAKIPSAVALCVASTLAYAAFFSIGLGPIPSVYSSEIYPLQVRALGSAVGGACNRVTSAVISMTFLSLSKAITTGGSFFLYSGLAAVGWVFFFTCLPETRRRTLEETGKLFGMPDPDIAEADDTTAKEKVVEMPTMYRWKIPLLGSARQDNDSCSVSVLAETASC